MSTGANLAQGSLQNAEVSTTGRELGYSQPQVEGSGLGASGVDRSEPSGGHPTGDPEVEIGRARRPRSRPARGPPRPTSRRASSSEPNTSSGPFFERDDHAALVDLELARSAPRSAVGRGAGDGQRAQELAVGELRAGRADCSSVEARQIALGGHAAQHDARAGHRDPPLAVAGERRHRLALDHLGSSACAGSRSSRAGRRPTCTARSPRAGPPRGRAASSSPAPRSRARRAPARRRRR